jgi:hypothetical protein
VILENVLKIHRRGKKCNSQQTNHIHRGTKLGLYSLWRNFHCTMKSRKIVNIINYIKCFLNKTNFDECRQKVVDVLRNFRLSQRFS